MAREIGRIQRPWMGHGRNGGYVRDSDMLLTSVYRERKDSCNSCVLAPFFFHGSALRGPVDDDYDGRFLARSLLISLYQKQ
jgi:hypothetical protein